MHKMLSSYSYLQVAKEKHVFCQLGEALFDQWYLIAKMLEE